MPPLQPKSRNFYAGGVDRASHLRKDLVWLGERLAHASSRFVLVWRGQNLIADYESPSPAAVFLPPEAIDAADKDTVLLGLENECAYFAIDLSQMEAPLDAVSRHARPSGTT